MGKWSRRSTGAGARVHGRREEGGGGWLALESIKIKVLHAKPIGWRL